MTTDDPATGHAWLEARALRTASDIALGCVLLAAAAAALLGASDFGSRGRLGPGLYPSLVGGLLAVAGVMLLVRGTLVGTPLPPRWSLTSLAIVVVLYVAINLVFSVWNSELLELALVFGSPEYVGLILLMLAIAIAFARLSRVRATGMVLLGLLLATVGIDVSTGVPRFTFGLDQLADGITYLVVWLGLIVVADGLLCLASPSLMLATYARRVAGWAGPRVPMLVAIAMRLVAVLAIAAAGYYAFDLSHSTWDVGMLAAFGLFGLLCKVLSWHRLVLIPAFGSGPLLEENIRRALVMSGSDPAIFVRRPVSAALIAVAAAVVLLMVTLSLWGMIGRRRSGAHS